MAVMAWSDTHLHRFRSTKDQRCPYYFGTGSPFEPKDEVGAYEGDVRVDQVLSSAGDKLWYEYDGWQLCIKLEKF
eukprot:JZ554747.1.p3 GENE.JZ554747.1~~JZ554747.1.p3  ORF type:complete len:75 (+),score=2.93 JZ554747.1:490-714(+)